MKELTFTLTVDEANLIFKALSRLPFGEVYTLIGKLNEQANQSAAVNPLSSVVNPPNKN